MWNGVSTDWEILCQSACNSHVQATGSGAGARARGTQKEGGSKNFSNWNVLKLEHLKLERHQPGTSSTWNVINLERHQIGMPDSKTMPLWIATAD